MAAAASAADAAPLLAKAAPPMKAAPPAKAGGRRKAVDREALQAAIKLLEAVAAAPLPEDVHGKVQVAFGAARTAYKAGR